MSNGLALPIVETERILLNHGHCETDHLPRRELFLILPLIFIILWKCWAADFVCGTLCQSRFYNEDPTSFPKLFIPQHPHIFRHPLPRVLLFLLSETKIRVTNSCWFPRCPLLSPSITVFRSSVFPRKSIKSINYHCHIRFHFIWHVTYIDPTFNQNNSRY